MHTCAILPLVHLRRAVQSMTAAATQMVAASSCVHHMYKRVPYACAVSYTLAMGVAAFGGLVGREAIGVCL